MSGPIEELIKDYGDGVISRREFIHRSAMLTGSLAAAAALADTLRPAPSYAAQVEPNDPALASSEMKFNSTDGTPILGYLTQPKAPGKYPAIVVIHENRGLNDHIRDVARRFAKSGYVALAPDLLSRQGGTQAFPGPDAAIEGIRKVSEDNIVQDLTGAINYLRAQNFVRPNSIGVVGFCWGGGNAFLIATRNKDLAAVVVYYGRHPTNLDDVKNIPAPVLAHYGEKDERITSTAPKVEEAMKKHGKSFEYKVYSGAPHAFNNDTEPQRYQAEAAKEAWAKTLEFFNKHLKS
jgi:carboxymethylenebutenolidase